MATGHGICTDHPDADLVDYRGDQICSERGQVVVIRFELHKSFCCLHG